MNNAVELWEIKPILKWGLYILTARMGNGKKGGGGNTWRLGVESYTMELLDEASYVFKDTKASYSYITINLLAQQWPDKCTTAFQLFIPNILISNVGSNFITSERFTPHYPSGSFLWLFQSMQTNHAG